MPARESSRRAELPVSPALPATAPALCARPGRRRHECCQFPGVGTRGLRSPEGGRDGRIRVREEVGGAAGAEGAGGRAGFAPDGPAAIHAHGGSHLPDRGRGRRLPLPLHGSFQPQAETRSARRKRERAGESDFEAWGSAGTPLTDRLSIARRAPAGRGRGIGRSPLPQGWIGLHPREGGERRTHTDRSDRVRAGYFPIRSNPYIGR